MKIVHLIVGLTMGGAEGMLYKMVSAAVSERPKEKHVVISLGDSGVYGKRLRQLGIEVHTLNAERGGLPLVAGIRLWTLLARIRPELVQCWMYHAMLAGTLMKFIPGISYKLVWNVRYALDDLAAEKFATRLLIRSLAYMSGLPNRIVYNSYTSRDQHGRIGYQAHSAIVIPNGFDTDRFRPDIGAKARLKEKLGVSGSIPLIGVVGRFHPVKGFPYFVEAAAHVSKLYDCDFVMVGEGVDNQNKLLVGLIEKYGLEKRLHLIGPVDDVPQLMAALDVYVSSSTSEAFANVIGEAMACGVPCVVTDVGDSARIVGDSGHVVPPRDSSALARGIVRYLELDEEERRKLGKKARTKIMERYSVYGVMDMYSQLFNELLLADQE